MIDNHPVFKVTSNENISIWKYLDFVKFISLLNNKSLFFSRTDKLEDPYEGSLPKSALEYLKPFFKDFENHEEMVSEVVKSNDNLRKITIVNCWHISEYENDAMWKIYSKDSFGIAIKSTIKKFSESLNNNKDRIYLGEVKYIDYDDVIPPEIIGFGSVIYKRKSFEHERELRAAIIGLPEDELEKVKQESDGEITYSIPITDYGRYVNTDLNLLVEEIFVSPTAPEWFLDLITSIVKKFNYNFKVTKSNLFTVTKDVDELENKDSKNLRILKEALDFFVRKDNERIKIEKEERDRIIKKQSESILYSYEEIKHETEDVKYKNSKGVTISGKSAFIEFNSEFNKNINDNELISSDYFNQIFLMLGRFDNLFIETLESQLSIEDKRILIKRVAFLYTSTYVQTLINILVFCEKNQIDDERFKIMQSAIIRIQQLFIEFKI